jgi:hypothetical protein
VNVEHIVVEGASSPSCASTKTHPTLADVIDSPGTAFTAGPTFVVKPTPPPPDLAQQ